MAHSSRHPYPLLLLLLRTLWRSRLLSQRQSLSPNLKLRPSLVTIMVQTPSSRSQSQAQRENQSRSLLVDLATPSLVQLPHSLLLSFLPLPSKTPSLPNITNSSTFSTQSCLPP